MDKKENKAIDRFVTEYSSRRTKTNYQHDRIVNRSSNIELYRIVAMLLIVAHHFVVNSGLNYENGPIFNDPLSFRSLYLLVFGAWGKTGINCFVLITGYYMCKSSISLRKYLKLLLEVLFYSIVIQIIFWITRYEAFSIVLLVKSILPVRIIGDDFTSAYLLFYLLIPFINILVHNINERQYIKLLTILAFMYVFLGTVPGFSITMNYVEWFIVLYVVGAYIRLYHKSYYENRNLWMGLTIISFTISIASIIVLTWIGSHLNRSFSYGFVGECNQLLALSNGVTSFLLFKNLNVKHSRTINTIASSTFGVLLIHAASDTMRRWLWQDVFDCVGHYTTPHIVLFSIGSVIIVFSACVIIDQIRIYAFEKPIFRWIEGRVKS